jgi:hypothetical protein
MLIVEVWYEPESLAQRCPLRLFGGGNRANVIGAPMFLARAP